MALSNPALNRSGAVWGVNRSGAVWGVGGLGGLACIIVYPAAQTLDDI